MSKTKPAYLPYLKTLRRVPRDIILNTATREFELFDNNSCLCGWVMREALAFDDGAPAEDKELPLEMTNGILDHPSKALCQARFGGTAREWENIYEGVTDERETLIEEAFTRRVAECVTNG